MALPDKYKVHTGDRCVDPSTPLRFAQDDIWGKFAVFLNISTIDRHPGGRVCGRATPAGIACLVRWESLVPFTLWYDCPRQSCQILIRCAEHHLLGVVTAEESPLRPVCALGTSPIGRGKGGLAAHRGEGYPPLGVVRRSRFSRYIFSSAICINTW